MYKTTLFILSLLCLNTVLCFSQTTTINNTKSLSSLCTVAQYDFAGNATDGSGNANHGTVRGAMLTTDRFGNPNSAYLFDGINDSITILDHNSLDLTTGFTLSAWVYPLSYGVQGGSANARIIDKPHVTLSEPYSMYNMILWHDGRVHTSLSIGGLRTPSNNLQGNAVVPLNQWSNIQISYTGTSLSIYINGQLDVTAAVSGNLDTNSQNLTLGYYQNASNFFDGKIDDVKILNCGFSAAQVDSMYQAENGCIINTTVSINGATLFSNSTVGTYQWIDCGNGNSPINGATSQSFTPSSSGTYAVILSYNGCMDTSICSVVTVVGFQAVPSFIDTRIYPNPFSDNLRIDINENEPVKLQIYTTSGILIYQKELDGRSKNKLAINHAAGVYIMELTNQKGNKRIVKIVKL